MTSPEQIEQIFNRIEQKQQTLEDIEVLRHSLLAGDRTYQGFDAEAIREVVRAIDRGSDAADIKEIVRSVLKEDFPNSSQPKNSPSSSSKTILVLASSPTNQARLRLDKEVREIDEGLRRSQHRDKFTLQQCWAVRPDDLRRALLDFNPQIIHFSGHGEGEDGLVLENDVGKAQLVSTQVLANLFKRFADRGLECVVLNSCYSEVQANAIAEHINFVVGMNSVIGDDAAIRFAVGFYDELGAGYPYKDAYHGGCDAIALQGIPEEHTPVFKNIK